MKPIFLVLIVIYSQAFASEQSWQLPYDRTQVFRSKSLTQIIDNQTGAVLKEFYNVLPGPAEIRDEKLIFISALLGFEGHFDLKTLEFKRSKYIQRLCSKIF